MRPVTVVKNSDMTDDLLCRRCRRPVRVSADRFGVFEQMHYVCFHYEFEHDPFDPDEECDAGGCPSFDLNQPSKRFRTSG